MILHFAWLIIVKLLPGRFVLIDPAVIIGALQFPRRRLVNADFDCWDAVVKPRPD